MQNQIGAVLFDCDGVLVDTEPLGRAILREELRACNVGATPLDDATLWRIWPVGAPLGRSLSEARAQHTLRFQGAWEPKGDSGIAVQAAWPQELEARIRAKMSEQLALRSYAIPGMPELFERLCRSNNCLVGVCSNGPIAKMKQSLRQDDFPSLDWSQVFSGHELGVFKPDPALLQHAAQSLGIDVRNILLVDDSEAGVSAAAFAGMPACHFGHAALAGTTPGNSPGTAFWTARDASGLAALFGELGLFTK